MKLNPTARWSTGVLALAIFMFSCQEMDSLDSNLLDKSELALSDGAGDNMNAGMMIKNVDPVIITGTSSGGNLECSEVSTYFKIPLFGASSNRVNTDANGFTGSFPAGFTVQLVDGKLNWSYSLPDKCLLDIAVIVKGGNQANVYYYKDGQTGGTGLIPPDNASGSAAGISNVTICYNFTTAPAAPKVKGDEACYEEDIKLTAKPVDVPVGITIVWYDKAEGGNVVTDPSITEVGSKTFYAEAVIGNCKSTSRSAATLTIFALPDAPTKPNSQEQCIQDFSSLTATVDVPEGVKVRWYDEDENLITDLTKLTISKLGTAIFYAEAVSDDDYECVGGRTKVTLTLKDCPVPCYNDETAWASRGAGLDRYNLRGGNWATWVDYMGVKTKTVNLYAGQTHLIGTVTFLIVNVDGKEMVKISINLNSDGAFQDVSNNVKIQDYASKPSGNPAPGGFAHKGTATGSSFEITVPLNNYYGVHVDAGRVVKCAPVLD